MENAGKGEGNVLVRDNIAQTEKIKDKKDFERKELDKKTQRGKITHPGNILESTCVANLHKNSPIKLGG